MLGPTTSDVSTCQHVLPSDQYQDKQPQQLWVVVAGGPRTLQAGGGLGGCQGFGMLHSTVTERHSHSVLTMALC